MTRRILIGAFAILLLGRPAGAQEPAPVVVPFPAFSGESRAPIVRLLPEIRTDADFLPGDATDPEEARSAAAGAIGNLLAPGLGTGALKVGAAAFELRGDPETVKLARSRLLAVSGFLEGRSVLSVAVVSLPGASDPAAVDAAAVKTALAAGEAHVLASGRLAGRRGESLDLDEVRSTRIAAAGSIEAASYSSVCSPVIQTLVTGLRLRLTCRPLSPDRAAVTLGLMLTGTPEPLEEVRVGGTTIDLPAVPLVSLFTGLEIGKGESAVVAVSHPSESGSVAVVVTAEELLPPPAAGELPFDLVDLAAAVGYPDARDALPPIGAFSREAESTSDDPPSTDRQDERIQELADRLEGFGLTVHQLTDRVAALTGPPAARVAGRELLAELSAGGRLSLREARLPWEEATRAPWFDPLTGRLTAPAAAKGLEWLGAVERGPGFSAPVRGGTPLLILRGTWRRFVAGIRSQTADGAAVLGPRVAERLDGIVIRATRRGDGLVVERAASVLLSRQARILAARTDENGVHREVSDQRVDAIRAAESRARFRLGAGEHSDLRREAGRAAADRFDYRRDR